MVRLPTLYGQLFSGSRSVQEGGLEPLKMILTQLSIFTNYKIFTKVPQFDEKHNDEVADPVWQTIL